MKRLQVYLLVQHWPGFSPPYLSFLQQLHQMRRFKLTVLNNGQPFNAKPLLNQVGLTCRVVQYPLRFHPAQILADCLQSLPVADAYFWFEDHLLWHPAALLEWLKELDKWTWITPNLLPAEAKPQSLRIYQAQALSPDLEAPRLMSANLDLFPPGMLFSRAAITTLGEWLQPEGQLPLLMLAACDANSNGWHPRPALEPTRADLALTLSEAQERWLKIQAKHCPQTRQRILLESLVRAFPDSPQVYLTLAPLLDARQALNLLQKALDRQLMFPELLNMLMHVLLACEQPAASQHVRAFLKARFPAYKKQVLTTWETVSDAPAFDLARLPLGTLSICLVLADRVGDLHSLLEPLQSLTDLCLEVLVLYHELPEALHNDLVASGYQLLQRADWVLETEDYNAMLAQASGEWVFILNAFETISAPTVSALQQVLACPPSGLPRFQIQVHQIFADGRETLIQPEIRLFPRHPLLRYQGAESAQLSCRLYSPLPVLRESQIYALVPLVSEAQALQIEQSQSQTLAAYSAQQPSAGLALRLAKQSMALGDRTAAFAWFEKVLELGVSAHSTEAYLQALALRLQSQADLATLQKYLEIVTPTLLNHPDYWYLKGHYCLKTKQYAEAYQAFENCLAYRSSEALLKLAYHPDYIFPGAVIALLDLDRYRMLAPQTDLRQREQAARKMLQRGLNLLGLYPDGQWLKQRLNLFYYLGEAIVYCARFQIDTRALHLFLASLPEVFLQTDVAYYTETAFIYLDGQTQRLAERLPPDYDESTLLALTREPQRLHGFCQTLWQRTEFDGHQIADKLLFFTAIARQEAELAMLLADLHLPENGLQILKMLKPHFETNPYYLYFYAKQAHAAGLNQEAKTLLLECLAVKSDYTEALSLLAGLEKNK